ncbi:MAG: hypothetical protein ABF876_12825 [Acetobacter aceti]|uniref:hypothetical protein n=1 Tax=Acetobacter aceti TaxID=435 RepID=UPI001656CCCE|nr:hypothetical protein [Acetobacter aceti]
MLSLFMKGGALFGRAEDGTHLDAMEIAEFPLNKGLSSRHHVIAIMPRFKH